MYPCITFKCTGHIRIKCTPVAETNCNGQLCFYFMSIYLCENMSKQSYVLLRQLVGEVCGGLWPFACAVGGRGEGAWGQLTL